MFDKIKEIIGTDLSSEKLEEIEKFLNEQKQEIKFVLKPFADYITEADPNDHASDYSEIGCFVAKSGLRQAIRYGAMKRARDLLSQL